MREILFKAKDKDDGNWYEGYYWCTSDTTYCIAEDYERHPDNTHHYLLFDRMVDWGLPNRKLKADIDPDTLCQFTGLYDKNRKKIWENDILKRTLFTGTEIIGIVKWVDIGRTGFCLEVKEENKTVHYPIGRGTFDDDESAVCDDLVVGNIFDNPELLNAS